MRRARPQRHARRTHGAHAGSHACTTGVRPLALRARGRLRVAWPRPQTLRPRGASALGYVRHQVGATPHRLARHADPRMVPPRAVRVWVRRAALARRRGPTRPQQVAACVSHSRDEWRAQRQLVRTHAPAAAHTIDDATLRRAPCRAGGGVGCGWCVGATQWCGQGSRRRLPNCGLRVPWARQCLRPQNSCDAAHT